MFPIDEFNYPDEVYSLATVHRLDEVITYIKFIRLINNTRFFLLIQFVDCLITFAFLIKSSELAP